MHKGISQCSGERDPGTGRGWTGRRIDLRVEQIRKRLGGLVIALVVRSSKDSVVWMLERSDFERCVLE